MTDPMPHYHESKSESSNVTHSGDSVTLMPHQSDTPQELEQQIRHTLIDAVKFGSKLGLTVNRVHDFTDGATEHLMELYSKAAASVEQQARLKELADLEHATWETENGTTVVDWSRIDDRIFEIRSELKKDIK